MPFGNSERSWLDEFWSLWHLDRYSDLEAARPRDLWAYEEKPKEQNSIVVKTDYCNFTPYISDRTLSKLDRN